MMKFPKLLAMTLVPCVLIACDTSSNSGSTGDESQSPGVISEGPSNSLPIVQIDGIDVIEDEIVLSIYNREADSDPYELDQLSLKIEIF